MDLPFIWFLLLGALLLGYAALDGFDLGVGILHPLARGDDERRALLNAIGPIWDGNEVWLVTFGGALFAAFPYAYATVLSGLYLPIMLMLLGLIFRAVSIEFRSKHPSVLWRRIWDYGFFGSSLLVTFVFGVAVGNAMRGFPLDARGLYAGSVADLVGLFPFLVGLLSVSLFAMHGTVFLHLRFEECPLRERLKSWFWGAWGLFLVSYLATTALAVTTVPRGRVLLGQHPWKLAVAVLGALAVGHVARATSLKKPWQAFLSSTAVIVALVGLFGLALYPDVVPARDPALGLSIARAASSPKTLTIMLIVAGIGMPLVVVYTAAVYWTFRHRVKVGDGKGY